LDAASNNSVEDIRNLVDQVRIPPQSGQYKVYIIDEVHMLSQAAFNAFLKTLEEPPAYAKFILATTEKHKIIPTILSRCQIYDFKRIGISDIAKHLAYIAQQESIEVEEDALHIIAQKADGALRDALSLFDQIVSFSGGKITYLNVIENLNVLDYEYYFRLIDSVLQKDVSQVLLIVNEIIQNGFDGQHFIGGLGNHLRNLLVAKDAATVQLLEVGQNVKKKYLQQANSVPTQFLLKALEINNEFDLQYKASSNKTLHLELDLLRLISLVGTPEEKKEMVILPDQNQIQRSASTTPTNPKPETESKSIAEAKEDSKKSEHSPTVPPSSNEKTNNDKSTPNVATKEKDIPQVSNQKPHTEKPTPKTSSSIPDVFSMGYSKPEKKKTETKVKREIHTQAVTRDELQSVIESFAQSIVNDPQLKVGLKAYPVELKANTICIKLDNPYQSKEFNEVKAQFLDYIDNKLNNNQLKIKIEIVEEQGQVDKRAYSESEKLEEMKKLNPELTHFIGQLQLKLDE
jgi:DNA polymerase-3 subunit gamma/tau